MRLYSMSLLVGIALFSASSAQTTGIDTTKCIDPCLDQQLVTKAGDYKACASLLKVASTKPNETIQCICNSDVIINDLRPCLNNCSAQAYDNVKTICASVGARVPEGNADVSVRLGRLSLAVLLTGPLSLMVLV